MNWIIDSLKVCFSIALICYQILKQIELFLVFRIFQLGNSTERLDLKMPFAYIFLKAKQIYLLFKHILQILIKNNLLCAWQELLAPKQMNMKVVCCI